jgi:hypothetical protein
LRLEVLGLLDRLQFLTKAGQQARLGIIGPNPVPCVLKGLFEALCQF